MVSQRIAALGLIAASSVANAGPCDIYASGGNPCVAAHSTTRALYNSYNGALYQVVRGSDGSTKDVYTLSVGGTANADTQDSFCKGTTCEISTIYDQTGNRNHLTRAPRGSAGPGPEAGGYDFLAGATGAPVTLNGKKAYGVFISPSTGYRCNDVRGTAKGDDPQGMYAVYDGTHYNGKCCFNYGNGETDTNDNGEGAMEAVYFGDGGGKGEGNGPWVQGDLERGLFSGPYKNKPNPDNKSLPHRFVTAIVKGEPHHWSIRGGNAVSGPLRTMYDGPRPIGEDKPDGYDPMRKEGAVILGIGGDNSIRGQGTFYEGVMTTGYPSDDTENKVQANIVEARYAAAPLTSGPALVVGSSVSMRATSPCCNTNYISKTGDDVRIQKVSCSSSRDDRLKASWIVHTGLGNSGCFSFESKAMPGYFIRHSNYELKINKNDGSKIFAEDATFCPEVGANGQGNIMRSWSYSARYLRHYTGKCYIAANGGPFAYDSKASFNDDVSFVVRTSLA